MIVNKLKISLFCASLVLAASCTGDFDEINTNKYGFSDEALKQDNNNIKLLYAPVYNNIMPDVHWQYQLAQNLSGDIWGGYNGIPTPFGGGVNNSTYAINRGWTSFQWNDTYTDVLPNLTKVINETKGTPASQYYAWALVMKVLAMHRMTDTFGPIQYSQFGKSTGTTTLYDSQQEVYTQMFEELDIAVAEFDAKIKKGEKTTFEAADKTNYKGDYAQWIKFANSLRLRLAMRVVKVAPATAKLQAEKAIANPYGVLTSIADIALVNTINPHPLNVVSNAWGDARMSADMESILTGYNDPRIAKFFTKATDPLVAGQYRGVRTGISIKAKADRVGMSEYGKLTEAKQIVWMTSAEVFFLRAEGALRGWNMGGTAQSLYEQGINASFAQLGVSGVDAYIADNIKMARDFVDVVDSKNNGAAVNKVTIAWDNAASNEVKLQKIITQKWIAIFPDGQEAWSEYRRTGYPKLFPVLKNDSNGTISTEFGPRRNLFSQSEIDGNKTGYDSGVSKLGGPDTGGTRLWWDTTGPNF
ncbi:RagB/SusD family nutrient uptake outer membrane protein [Flavobacterium sp.]|uniref:RagB/SusD family nutrient uptake outer membrane protein n=1 Tax=Flavobacterium sp. TaxID=239 RepID=UPI002625CC74|nr:RagB/SusD family nutrient uptake outer membrane protein [Flavobacterium sp.]